jgi:hypothetical protein
VFTKQNESSGREPTKTPQVAQNEVKGEVSEAPVCPFRLHVDGIYALYPYISRARVIDGHLEDVIVLLSELAPLIAKFRPELQEKLRDLGTWIPWEEIEMS